MLSLKTTELFSFEDSRTYSRKDHGTVPLKDNRTLHKSKPNDVSSIAAGIGQHDDEYVTILSSLSSTKREWICAE